MKMGVEMHLKGVNMEESWTVGGRTETCKHLNKKYATQGSLTASK